VNEVLPDEEFTIARTMLFPLCVWFQYKIVLVVETAKSVQFLSFLFISICLILNSFLTPTSQNCQERTTLVRNYLFCKKFNQHFVGRIRQKFRKCLSAYAGVGFPCVSLIGVTRMEASATSYHASADFAMGG